VGVVGEGVGEGEEVEEEGVMQVGIEWVAGGEGPRG